MSEPTRIIEPDAFMLIVLSISLAAQLVLLNMHWWPASAWVFVFMVGVLLTRAVQVICDAIAQHKGSDRND